MGRSLESSCFSAFFAYFTCSGFTGIEPEEPGRIRRVKEGRKRMTDGTPVTKNLEENEVWFRSRCEGCSDIKLQPMRLGKDAASLRLPSMWKIPYRI